MLQSTFRELALRSVKRMLSIVAIGLSGFVLIYSLITTTDAEVLIFMGYILTGFIVMEVIDIREGRRRRDLYPRLSGDEK